MGCLGGAHEEDGLQEELCLCQGALKRNVLVNIYRTLQYPIRIGTTLGRIHVQNI